MDGPGGNLPRRRAGDSNTPQNPSPIKDWQRNTWFGPAPQDSNPFDEPDEAPELLEMRSDNVKQKSGEFWQEQTGYLSGAYSPGKGSSASRRKKKKKDDRGHGFLGRMIVIILLLAAGTAAVLFFSVYRIRSIRVEGNVRISADDIIAFSGIKPGDSILTLNEKQVSERMLSNARSNGKRNQNYYSLQFRYLKQLMPDTVIISVKEREPCCWVDLRGIIYVLDKDRMILWETEKRSEGPVNLVEVRGLKDKADSRGGQTLELESSVQQRIFRELFLEMKALGCLEAIKEVDLSNADHETNPSVLLETRDGYTVKLGDCRSSDPEVNRIHAKLRSFMLVRDRMNSLSQAERESIENRIGQSISGGSIDVTTPESPYFSPGSAQ